MHKGAHFQPSEPPLIVAESSLLYGRLKSLATQQRMVFFAGLPGTGKSLLIHQLAHLAAAVERQVHLLQWDVARPVFEAHPAARAYPMQNGVTHGVIRKAIGLWVRQAVNGWHRDHPDFHHLLIGETPFIGNRFIELAQITGDEAEIQLASASCMFVIPVPSPQVRRFIEAERVRRSDNPVHVREVEDAPPQVLHQLWLELTQTAVYLGIKGAPTQPDAGYEPQIYQRVYEALLRNRHTQVMPIDTILPSPQLSVYDFSIPHTELVPIPREVEESIYTIDNRYSDAATLRRDLLQWYLV